MKSAILLITSLIAFKAHASSRVINGTPSDAGEFSEVVLLRSAGGGTCNATKVGPRAFVTAAHCAGSGHGEVVIEGKNHPVTLIRHKDFPSKDMDIGLAISDNIVESVPSVSITGQAWKGLPLTIVGSGCTNPGGGGGNDGVFRKGVATVTGFSNNDIVSTGAALCYGDSGGPAYSIIGDSKVLIGIGSKGNIQDINYHHNLSLPATQQFLEETANEQGVDICGITTDCL